MSDVEKVVVDASVVVKWFVKEEGSEEALAIRRRYIEEEVEIVAPELIHLSSERSSLQGALHRTRDQAYSGIVGRVLVDLRSLREEYAAQALEAAFENDITVYDSSYLSLARSEGAQYYTGDLKLVQRLREPYPT